MVLAYSNDKFILIKDGRYPGTSSTLEQAFAIAGTGAVQVAAYAVDSKLVMHGTKWYTTHMSAIELPDDLTYGQFILQNALNYLFKETLWTFLSLSN